EGAARAELACERDVTAHHLAETTTQNQSESGSSVLARRRGLGLRERLEKPRDLFRRQADTSVTHRESHAFLAGLDLSGHFQGDRAVFGELACVTEKVEQGLPSLGQIGTHGS